MTIMRLARPLIAAVIALSGWSTVARAEAGFPSRPIRIVVPYAPSGSPDVISRLMAQRMSETLGQQVIVDNRPGGTGVPAAAFVARSAPDGYTILAVDGNIYGVVPALNANLPYDPVKDFVPLVQSVTVPLFLVVNSGLPVHSVPELITYLKAHPATDYGSPGLASIHQLATEQFLTLAGLKLTHIPYRGVLQAVPALLTGDVKLMFNSLPSISGHVEAGKLRILAIAERRRSKLRPDIPTVAETLPGAGLDFTMGYAVPTGTPEPIRKRLEVAMLEALHSKDMTSRLPSLGLDLIGKGGNDYATAIPNEQKTLGRLVHDAKIKLN